MSLQKRREEIIEHLQGVRSKFLGAMEGLSDADMNDPAIDGWSVKDHMMHLAFWHELRASEIQRISAGYEHAWPLTVDSQVVNDVVHPARTNLSLDQARWEYDTAFQKVVDAVSAANERGLTQEHYGEVGLWTTHDLAHADFILSWRRRRTT